MIDIEDACNSFSEGVEVFCATAHHRFAVQEALKGLRCQLVQFSFVKEGEIEKVNEEIKLWRLYCHEDDVLKANQILKEELEAGN